MFALVIAFFAVQAGYHGFTASLPVALVKAGLPDAEIGLIVGVASVIQVPAAFFAGGLIDRFGGPRVLLLGCLSYLAAAVLLALPLAEPGGSGAIPIFVIARIFQGIGVSTTTPAAFAVVPGLVARTRVGVGLAQAGAAQNLTMAILPPLSLFVLDATGLHGVAALIAAVVAVGALLVLRLERSLQRAAQDHPAGAGTALRPRWVGFAWHRAWALPLLVVVTMTIHWGVVVAYLAQVAEPAGVNLGIFFTADALAVFAFRIPVGWLVDRVPPRPFVLAGLLGLLACVLLLLIPPSTGVFVISGFFAGAGGILVIGPLLMTMSHRSTDRDRGSAFAFFYVAMALGNAIGSVGGAAFVAAGGFGLAMTSLGVTGLVLAAILTLADGGLAQRSGLAVRAAVVAAAD
jgi:MFS family permease